MENQNYLAAPLLPTEPDIQSYPITPTKKTNYCKMLMIFGASLIPAAGMAWFTSCIALATASIVIRTLSAIAAGIASYGIMACIMHRNIEHCERSTTRRLSNASNHTDDDHLSMVDYSNFDDHNFGTNNI